MKINYSSKSESKTVINLVSEESLKFFKLSEEELKDFKNAKSGEILINYSEGFRNIFLGFGKEEEITHVIVINNTQKLVNKLNSLEVEFLSFKNFLKIDFTINHFINTLITQNYYFDKYLSKKKKLIKEITLIDFNKKHSKIIESIAKNTNYAKDLVNDNADFTTPEFFEKETKKLSQSLNIELEILNNEKMKKLGMGLITGSGAASNFPPRILILKHLPNKNEIPILIVGKGITFDTGGINLKPTNYIETMRTDMAGAATVLSIMKTVKEINLKKNIICCLAVSENMIGPNAIKPGDVLIAYNGLSVEIGNTDAEGRLVLADAISYCVKEYTPSKIIDLATLTGSIVKSLGSHATGIIGNDESLIKKIKKSGLHTHQRVWQMPLWDEHKKMIKSKIADINNISSETHSGAIVGAAFIERFVEKTPWAHLDIAGSSFLEKPVENLRIGATGVGVELIVHYLLEN